MEGEAAAAGKRMIKAPSQHHPSLGKSDLIEECCKTVPTFEHVIDRLCDRSTARQLCPLGLEPIVQFFYERQAVLPAVLQALLGSNSVDLPFDVEQDIDPIW